MSLKVAVIAGTNVDTQMGVDYLKMKDPSLDVYFMPVSDTCENQILFQYSSFEKKKERLDSMFDEAMAKGINNFFIYCNSLSSSIDFNIFRMERNVNIFTPLEVYDELATKYSLIALIAANSVTTKTIEGRMLDINNDIVMFNLGAMPFVKAIERNMPPAEMIKKFNMKALMDFFKASDMEVLIIGCTHFPYFKDELRKVTDIPFVDPADEMYNKMMQLNS